MAELKEMESRVVAGEELQAEENKLQAIIEAKDKFQDFFDNAPVGYHSFRPDRIIYEMNKAELDMIGFSRNEIVGKKTWADLILPDQKSIFEQHWKQINKTGSVNNIEYTLVHKNGRHIDVLLSATMMYNKEGEPLRTRGIVIDITEHKRIKAELQAERNKLQSILEFAQDGLSIQNLDYDIIYQNEILRNIFGHLGEKCFSVYEGKDKVCDGCPVEMAFKDGKHHMSERKIVMPSGKIAYWENMASPIRDANGKIVSCLEVSRDVTDRKRTEESLKESESKLQEQKRSLKQKNMALKEILEQIEIEKKQIKDDVIVNVEKTLFPMLEKFKVKGVSRKYVNLMRQNLHELTSSFGRKLTERSAILTPRESEICNMIKNGLSSKEIASLLNISTRTIERHRLNIRKKLGIASNGTNLTSFLHTF
ncbi:MAG: PAS domain S-box protein [Candidatus Scalindua sp.]